MPGSPLSERGAQPRDRLGEGIAHGGRIEGATWSTSSDDEPSTIGEESPALPGDGLTVNQDVGSGDGGREENRRRAGEDQQRAQDPPDTTTHAGCQSNGPAKPAE